MKKGSQLDLISKLPVQRIMLAKDAQVHYSTAVPSESFTCLENLVSFFKAAMQGCPVEEFWCVALDSANRPITAFRPDQGTPNQAVIYPSKIARGLLLACASGCVVAHNHPSNEAKPSIQDRELTRALQAALATVQIRLLDHLIITDTEEFFSCRREGLL
jgi:DNA repair protein RadC